MSRFWRCAVGAEIRSVPWVRQLVIDTGRAARRRHAIHGLFKVDVTSARSALRRNGNAGLFTAFVIHCVGAAVATDLSVQAYRDLRGRDHDVVDGAPAARFVGRVRALLTAGDGIQLTKKEPV